MTQRGPAIQWEDIMVDAPGEDRGGLVETYGIDVLQKAHHLLMLGANAERLAITPGERWIEKASAQEHPTTTAGAPCIRCIRFSRAGGAVGRADHCLHR